MMMSPLASVTRVRPGHSGSVRCQAQLGDRVLPLLRGPADFLFLGPRVALGALLSTGQSLEQLPADLERLATLATDPRPLELKRDDVLLEVEVRLASFLERGLGVESEAIATVSAAIPEDLKQALPQELRDALAPRQPPPPPPRPAAADNGGSAGAAQWSPSGSAYAASGNGSGEAKPLATWTVDSMDEDDARFPATPTPSGLRDAAAADEGPFVSAVAVAASQAAAELVDIQAAVVAVRGRLAELQANTDAARQPMLKLNLREAAAGLATRLRQRALTAAAADPGVAAAVAEAEVLLAEVEALAR